MTLYDSNGFIAGAPPWFWIASAAVLGGAIGSFLNVCIYRMPRRCMSISHPRHSRCPRCGHDIRWYENIPVLSWVLLTGKCSGCKLPISPIYPFIEALTALFFAAAAKLAITMPPLWLQGTGTRWFSPVAPEAWMCLAWFAVAAWLIAGLIVSTFVDFEFRIIPDQVSMSGMWLAPVVSFALPWLHRPVMRLEPLTDVPSLLPHGWAHLEGLCASLIGAAVAAGAVWIVGFFGKIAFRKEAMGFGDVKLMAWIGGLIGWKASIFAFLMASCLGAAVGVPVLVANKAMNAMRVAKGKPRIPFDNYLAFGPYLAAAGLAMFLWYPAIDSFAFVDYPAFLHRIADRLAGRP